jgi:hypothetical protein
LAASAYGSASASLAASASAYGSAVASGSFASAALC